MISRDRVILECAASRVACGVVGRRGGRLRLCGHAVVPLDPARDWMEQVGPALARLGRPGRRRERCVLVLPGHLVLTRFLRVPAVGPAQREQSIRFELEQTMPFALDELVWDHAVSAAHESGLDVLVAAIQRAKLEALTAAARAAGFEPRTWLPAPLATLAAFRLRHGENAAPAAVINVGARSGTLLLMDAPAFAIRTFALGAMAPAAGESTDAAGTLATQLAREFTRTRVYFHQQQRGLADPARIYLTGGGTQVPGLEARLGDNLSCPVARLDLADAFEVAAEAGLPEGGGGNLTDIVGAAAGILREGQVSLNLNPSRRPSASARKRRRVAVAFGLVAVAGALGFWPRASSRDIPRPAVVPSVVAERAPSSPPAVAPAPESAPEPAEPAPPEEKWPGMELVEVRTVAEPYRLQLLGYVGEPGDYVAAFVSPGNPQTWLARVGWRSESVGLTLTHFEVRTLGATDPASRREVAGLAVLRDERTGQDVVLDSRVRKVIDVPQAVLRLAAEAGDARILGEGDVISDAAASYRIERIQAAPPEVVLARQGSGAAGFRVLRPAGGDGGGSESLLAPPRAGIASTQP